MSPLPPIHVEALTLNVIVFGDGLWEVIRLRGGQEVVVRARGWA